MKVTISFQGICDAFVLVLRTFCILISMAVAAMLVYMLYLEASEWNWGWYMLWTVVKVVGAITAVVLAIGTLAMLYEKNPTLTVGKYRKERDFPRAKIQTRRQA